MQFDAAALLVSPQHRRAAYSAAGSALQTPVQQRLTLPESHHRIHTLHKEPRENKRNKIRNQNPFRETYRGQGQSQNQIRQRCEAYGPE